MSEQNSYRNDLPKSKRSKMPYEDLLKMNQKYLKKLIKFSVNCKEMRKKLSKDDIIVIDDLLKENLAYITILSKQPLNQIEFKNLYELSLQILTTLQKFIIQKDILLYEKLQRIKFYEMRAVSLSNSEAEEDLQQFEALLDELEELHRDPDVIKYISLIKIANRIMFKAMIRFNVGDINTAENLALSALDLLEKNKSTDEDPSRVKKISQILEFLAEIFDFKKE